MFMKTQFELSVMSWDTLRMHYNACAKAKMYLENLEHGKLTAEEQKYFDDLLWLCQNHCENPARHLVIDDDKRRFAQTLGYYNQ